MAVLNHEQKSIHTRVVYAGPDGSGKTENLEFIFLKTSGPGAERSRVTSTGEPNYDFLPLRLGDIRGFAVYFELTTMPGTPGAIDTRRSLLQRVDGLVFVADASPGRGPANVASLHELRALLADNGFALEKLPLVLQINKCDVPGASSVDTVRAELGLPAVEAFASIAPRGVGVFDSLKSIAKQVLTELKRA